VWGRLRDVGSTVRVQRIVGCYQSLAKGIDSNIRDARGWLKQIVPSTTLSMHKNNPSALAGLPLILKPDLHLTIGEVRFASELTFAGEVLNVGLCRVGVALKLFQQNPQRKWRHSETRRMTVRLESGAHTTALAFRRQFGLTHHLHVGINKLYASKKK